MDWKLELVVVPVSDMDRAKAFYSEKAGFGVDVDYSAGNDFRVVQLTPPGSACSITVMRNPERAGSLQGLYLIVSDIDAARAELVGRGMDVSDLFHFEQGGQLPGPHPAATTARSSPSATPTATPGLFRRSGERSRGHERHARRYVPATAQVIRILLS
jgi:predicted enzyme related to lactoylglutathione lyase